LITNCSKITKNELHIYLQELETSVQQSLWLLQAFRSGRRRWPRSSEGFVDRFRTGKTGSNMFRKCGKMGPKTFGMLRSCFERRLRKTLRRKNPANPTFEGCIKQNSYFGSSQWFQNLDGESQLIPIY